MHDIVIASYLVAAGAFALAAIWLALGWRGLRTGGLLILALTISVLWALLLAWAEWSGRVGVHWVLLAEVLRYGVWLSFITALFHAWPLSRGLRLVRIGTHVLWPALALYCLLPTAGIASPMGRLFGIAVPLVGILLLALIGLMLLEQLARNAVAEQRWALKFLLIALAGWFAYDIFVYSYAALYHSFNASVWAARGFVDALLVPLVLMAAARNRSWSLEVSMSRQVVFYSTSLLVVACYLIAVALGGYYVRIYGGDWGRVAEIALVCFALLLALTIASSGQARSRLKVLLHKNFFRLRHDYREHWLRLTATLAATDSAIELPVRAVRALAATMDSPAGALFVREEGGNFAPAAEWNLSLPADLHLDAQAPAFAFMRERQWVYDLQAPPPGQRADLRAPAALADLDAAWLLVPLILEQKLIGLVLLTQARARRAIDWEDIDLLRTAGSQVAGTLMQAANAQRLAEAQQFEGFNRLTAFLMHDLKNIAAQQSLLLQNAPRHKHNPAFIEDMLVTVDNSVQRISRLLEQLRGNAAPTSHQRIHLATVMDKALASCQAHQPTPVCTRPPAPVHIAADPDLLASALEHLLRNAQDAAGADGHVGLDWCVQRDQAMIEITDDGVGMDEEFVRNRLFKPFFTTKASRGMGIGAYQARSYVRSLGGTLTVASQPGHGTTFTIHLPLATTSAAVPTDTITRATT